jgi:hypothetical protein
MAMHHIDLLAGQDLSNYWDSMEKRKESHSVLAERYLGHMVQLNAIPKIPHTASVVLVLVCQKAHLMAALNQALRQLVPVGFHAPKFGEHKVHADHYV